MHTTGDQLKHLYRPHCSSQLLINGVWIIINPAHAIHHYPTREDNLLVCDSYIDASYMIAFFYPIVLIVICTIYAVLTRKIPEAFNESKHIGESIHMLISSVFISYEVPLWQVFTRRMHCNANKLHFVV